MLLSLHLVKAFLGRFLGFLGDVGILECPAPVRRQLIRVNQGGRGGLNLRLKAAGNVARILVCQITGFGHYQWQILAMLPRGLLRRIDCPTIASVELVLKDILRVHFGFLGRIRVVQVSLVAASDLSFGGHVEVCWLFGSSVGMVA
jgi:hypothetical protein